MMSDTLAPLPGAWIRDWITGTTKFRRKLTGQGNLKEVTELLSNQFVHANLKNYTYLNNRIVQCYFSL